MDKILAGQGIQKSLSSKSRNKMRSALALSPLALFREAFPNRSTTSGAIMLNPRFNAAFAGLALPSRVPPQYERQQPSPEPGYRLPKHVYAGPITPESVRTAQVRNPGGVGIVKTDPGERVTEAHSTLWEGQMIVHQIKPTTNPPEKGCIQCLWVPRHPGNPEVRYNQGT